MGFTDNMLLSLVLDLLSFTVTYVHVITPRDFNTDTNFHAVLLVSVLVVINVYQYLQVVQGKLKIILRVLQENNLCYNNLYKCSRKCQFRIGAFFL